MVLPPLGPSLLDNRTEVEERNGMGLLRCLHLASAPMPVVLLAESPFGLSLEILGLEHWACVLWPGSCSLLVFLLSWILSLTLCDAYG